MPRTFVMACVFASLTLHAAEIHDAAGRGDAVKVRQLIEQDGALLNAQDQGGNTPLLIAAREGRVEVVRYLLDQKADLDRANSMRSTPLHMAAIRGHAAVARLLVERGASVRVRDQWGHIALHNAFGVNGQDLELIRLLIAKGSDLDARGTRGEAPLHWAAGRGNVEPARLLIDAGADLNPIDFVYGTPLHQAVEQSRVEVAQFLVERGAQLSERDAYGYTPLHLAAIRGRAGLVKAMLAKGADPKAGDRYGRTALYHARHHGWHSAAQVLEAAGANLEPEAAKPMDVSATLPAGEARLWYLGGDGYAVKTRGHLLIFDPPGMDDGPESALANGNLNPKELDGQNVTILISKPDWERYELGALGLASRLKGVNIVMAFKPDGRPGVGTPPPYRLAEAGQTFEIGGVRVQAVGATLGGLAYLVESDGLRIVHAGYHVCNQPAQAQGFRAGIDQFGAGSIDIALLPVSGHTIEPFTYESYGYLAKRLSPKAVYLMHGFYGRQSYWECSALLQQRGLQVQYPENPGDRFHYQRERLTP